MALKSSRGGREYDKFVADSGGDTALRTTSTSSVTSTTSSVGSDVTPTTGGLALSAGANTAVIGKGTVSADANVEVAGKNRIGIQIFNTGANSVTCKVMGNLVEDSAGPVTGTDYTQIGDDIVVANGTSAYKAIATTPIFNIGLSAVAASGGTKINAYLMAD